MRSSQALVTALSVVNCPPMTHWARQSPLPKGVTFLLEVAAGDGEALSEAQELTGQTEEKLRQAAGFFVEQVLLSQPVDYYRMLGCSCQASNADLRRHMALIMKWLHPDVVTGASPDSGFDKSLYTSRVTEAWEALKTEGRRAAYDAARAKHPNPQKTRPVERARHLPPAAPFKIIAAPEMRFEAVRLFSPAKPVSFWTRVFNLFVGRL